MSTWEQNKTLGAVKEVQRAKDILGKVYEKEVYIIGRWKRLFRGRGKNGLTDRQLKASENNLLESEEMDRANQIRGRMRQMDSQEGNGTDGGTKFKGRENKTEKS